jgi:mannitol-1-phosphate 5-dehydrogenase
LNQSAAVVGAGKIARGFIGHLLYLSGFETTFVDVDASLVAKLRAAGSYNIYILGDPSKNCVVSDIHAYVNVDEGAAAAISSSDVIFISVGGTNLESLGPLLAQALDRRALDRRGPVNIVVCENWPGAARSLSAAITSALGPLRTARTSGLFGVAESTVLRSCIEPTPEQRLADPLSIQAQDHWTLEVDADALVTRLPEIIGLTPIHNFAHALERKVYTYNMCNATISYIGSLLGYLTLAEAARDVRVLRVVSHANEQVGTAICRAFGYAPEDQAAFADKALKKFQDPTIADPIRRQTHDPLRKLSRHDRLIGPAMMCIEQGVEPAAVAIAIAAALRYRDPHDPSAVEMRRLVETMGESRALSRIGELPLDSPLVSLVAQQAGALDKILSGRWS